MCYTSENFVDYYIRVICRNGDFSARRYYKLISGKYFISFYLIIFAIQKRGKLYVQIEVMFQLFLCITLVYSFYVQYLFNIFFRYYRK